MSKSTEREPSAIELEFLLRIHQWDVEVARIGNDAVDGPFAGYGHAFGKWKPVAERLDDAGLCKISGNADWFKRNAWCVFPTDLGREALKKAGLIT